MKLADHLSSYYLVKIHIPLIFLEIKKSERQIRKCGFGVKQNQKNIFLFQNFIFKTGICLSDFYICRSLRSISLDCIFVMRDQILNLSADQMHDK